MKKPEKSHLCDSIVKSELCDVCGNTGHNEDIATCSECNQARQHIYCMRKRHCSVPENWRCESCRSRNIEEEPDKKVKSEKTIAPPKEFLTVKNEENPMLVESDNKPQNGIRKPICTDNPSSKIINTRKKEDYLVQVPLHFNKLISVPHDSGDASKKGEISPALRSLPTKFEGNHMLGNSDDMPLDRMRKLHPNIDRANTFLGMGKNESVPVPSKPVSSPLTRGSSRIGDNSKVKFLPTEEAALLGSSPKAKPSIGRVSLGNVPSVAKRTSNVPTTEASKACLQKENSNNISRTPPRYNKPVTHENIRLGTSIHCPLVKAPRESHIERPSSRVCKPSTSERLMGIDDKLFIPRPVAVKSERSIGHEAFHSPSKYAGSIESKYNGKTTSTPSNNEDLMRTMNNASGYREAYHSPSKHAGSAESKYNGETTFTLSNNEDMMQTMNNASGDAPFADVQFKSSDAQESVLPLLPSEFLEGKSQNHLDPETLWKGSFEIYDAVCRSDFYEGIEAHRPSTVSHKVCEVSKHMPKKLQFKLHPRLEIWPQIFRKECPTANDIALYFLPGDSSKKKYIYLLELIEMDDLAMRADLGGVELLIFTSKQLPVDCQTGPDMKLYLWGIFRRLKDTKVYYLDEGLSYTAAPDTDNAEGSDMEIDMVAGKDVGRKDKPVPRPVSFGSGKLSEFPLHLNGQKVSSSQLVSSNLESSLGRKRVRFSIDTRTSNFKKITNNRVLDGTPDVLSGKYKEKETERSAVSVPKSVLHVNRSTLRSNDSMHLISQHHHGPYDECMRAPSSVKANRLEVADYSIPDVPPGFSKLSTNVAAQEKSFSKSELKKPTIQKPSSVKANRLEVADYSIPDVPPGFSKLSANVAAQETSLSKSELKKPTIQKVVDGSTHFSKPINSKHEFHTSVVGHKREKASVGATYLQTTSKMPSARDMDISPGFSKQLDYKDKCRSSEANEKDEHYSFDTTNRKYNDAAMLKREKYTHSSHATMDKDLTPGFPKQLECKSHSSKVILKREKDEYHSSEVTKSMDVSPVFLKQPAFENLPLKPTCKKENDQCLSSQASSKKAKDAHRPFEAFSEGEKDEYDSSKSTDRNTKAIMGISEVGNHLKDAGNVECASSEGSIQGSGLQAQKSTTATESPQVPFMYHQVSHHCLESPLLMDSAACSMVDTPTHINSQFLSGSTSCLELFPLEVEPRTQEIEVVGTDNSLVLSNAQCAKDSYPAEGEESLVLSLSRPQYLNDGNNWITVLSRERLQQDGSGEELQLTL